MTVRAEISRVRRYLGGLLEHRPYRFARSAEVDVLLPDDPRDLLPHSTAPAPGAREHRPATGLRTRRAGAEVCGEA